MLTKELQIVERVYSETNLGGTGCRKAARPDLWGSGEVTNRSTRKLVNVLYFFDPILFIADK